MVKVPLGSEVEVNLWNTKKKKGMVKYYTHTMDLIRAESEFELEKGDKALVVESFDSFVVVVPDDKFSKLIRGDFDEIDIDGLNHQIWKLLSERQEESGGILSFEELLSILKRTSIQGIISKKILKKATKSTKIPYERIKEDGKIFVALKMEEISFDKKEIVKFALDKPYLTKDLIQAEYGWSDLRIERILNFLIEEDRCRLEESYREGNRYYFINT